MIVRGEEVKHQFPGIEEEVYRSMDSISTLESDNMSLGCLEAELFKEIRALIQKSTRASNPINLSIKLSPGNGDSHAKVSSSSKMVDLESGIQPVARFKDNASTTPQPMIIARVNSTSTLTKTVSLTTNVAKGQEIVEQAHASQKGTLAAKMTRGSKVAGVIGPRRGVLKPFPSSKSAALGSKTELTRPSSSSSNSSSCSSGTDVKISVNLSRKKVELKRSKLTAGSVPQTSPAPANSRLSSRFVSSKFSSRVSSASSESEWSSESTSSTSSINRRSMSGGSINTCVSYRSSFESASSIHSTDQNSNKNRNQAIDVPPSQTGSLSRPPSAQPTGLRLLSPKIGFFDGLSMRDFWLICMYFLLVPVVAGHSNYTVLEKLEIMTKQIDLEVDSYPISVQDGYLYYLWGQCAHSPRLEKLKALKFLSQQLAHKSYVDSTIDMVALILTGSQKGPALMRLIVDDTSSIDEQCVQSTLNLFRKSCGALTQVEMIRNMRCFQNMCKYAGEMKAIEEAILAACGSDMIEPSVIDAENPRIDVIPAPTRGSLDFCERVSVPGVSRINLKSYAKAYRLLFNPLLLIPRQSLHKIQICIHRNSSRGLCQCKEEDWKPIRMIHGSILSPYEQVYIDVKFTGGISGSVTITLDEVSQGHWRYWFLVAGIGFLFLAPYLGQAIVGENLYNGVDQLIRLTLHIFAVACIYHSSIDTLLALVAIGSAVTLYYMMNYIVRFGA